ncbi:MAG: 2-dehydropantoate 2-reductase [Deltaproteobacteria bacterium]|nr:2-dehydropantoate 2-reductase [Deltaproteobacteria bacterium]
MKICVYGAGAVGGYIAARLALSGKNVTAIARGSHLEAIKKNGLKLLVRDEVFNVNLQATNDPHEAGIQDLVILTVKGPSLSGVVDHIKPLLNEETPIIFAMNGIPWWYFYGIDEPGKERQFDILDPGNRLWNEIRPERAVGGVVFSADIVVEPGVVRNNTPDRNLLIIGEPNGTVSKRCKSINRSLNISDLSVSVVDDIRYEIWNKLLANMAFAPICTLTSSTIGDVILDKDLRVLALETMREAVFIANALGVKLDIDLEERINSGMKAMTHKPSMLQDFELGRPMEICSILLTPQIFGRMTGVPTPNLDTLISLLKIKARNAGLY